MFFPILSRFTNIERVEDRLLSHFMDRLLNDYDSVISKIAARGKVMYISKMRWGGAYFNVAVLNNLMELIIYCLYLGYIPVVRINEDHDELFSWWWYFKQPLEDQTQNIRIRSSRTLDRTHLNFPMWWFYSQSGQHYNRWRLAYQKFLRLNENAVTGDLSNVLGALMRGTDYLSLRPKLHPVQPDLSEVIQKSHEILQKYHYRAIYMATEEEKYFDAIAEEFGEENVLSNKRVYYDRHYIPGTYIGEIHFDRENDNYIKGLEYLSSMVLLSRCDSIVAGNCHGTFFALMYGEKPYRECCIFNKGVY